MSSQRPFRAVSPRDLYEGDYSEDEEDDSGSVDALESDAQAATEYVVNWFNSVMPRTPKYRTGLAYDDRMRFHQHPSQSHPECPERIEVIMETFKQTGLMSKLFNIPVKEAQESDILNIHSRKHLAFVKSLDDPSERETQRSYLDRHSAYASEGSVTAAFVSAGAVVSAVEHLASKVVRNAVCVVRPPGHHAENSKVCGFCLFDNVAVAASVAIKKHGYERVLILGQLFRFQEPL
jgi:histone deacetylase 6